MAEEKKKFVESLNMADRRKQIDKLYDGSDDSLRRIFDKSYGSAIGNKYNEDFLDKIFRAVGTEALDKELLNKINTYAYSTDPNFASIIDYFANMYLWRYYYVPVKIRKNAEENDYPEVYNLMSEVVDGMSIQTIFPMILTKLFTEGAVYLYTIRNRPSKTVSTLILNSEYCRPVMKSQYGTGIFQFSLKYFDDLVLYGEELEGILELFPEELTSAYKAYKDPMNKPNRSYSWITLDARYSTYINTNDYSFPTLTSVIKSLFDYEQYRKNEVERSNAQLDTIMTHKIPSYENRLLFELPEVKSLHKSMSKILGQNKRTRLITTFGDVQLHPVQEQSKISNEAVKMGHEAIFRASGLNSNAFNGTIKDSLDISLKRDQSTIWKYVQQLVNFYNLTINNLYSFRGYQIELTMLPITHYNAMEMMEIHRRNAEYGIGRLEAVVASGTKQKHISYKSKLEEYLELSTILKPLASSHTQSGNTEEEEEIEESVETQQSDN